MGAGFDPAKRINLQHQSGEQKKKAYDAPREWQVKNSPYAFAYKVKAVQDDDLDENNNELHVQPQPSINMR